MEIFPNSRNGDMELRCILRQTSICGQFLWNCPFLLPTQAPMEFFDTDTKSSPELGILLKGIWNAANNKSELITFISFVEISDILDFVDGSLPTQEMFSNFIAGPSLLNSPMEQLRLIFLSRSTQTSCFASLIPIDHLWKHYLRNLYRSTSFLLLHLRLSSLRPRPSCFAPSI
jgi:hypothetical protein